MGTLQQIPCDKLNVAGGRANQYELFCFLAAIKNQNNKLWRIHVIKYLNCRNLVANNIRDLKRWESLSSIQIYGTIQLRHRLLLIIPFFLSALSISDATIDSFQIKWMIKWKIEYVNVIRTVSFQNWCIVCGSALKERPVISIYSIFFSPTLAYAFKLNLHVDIFVCASSLCNVANNVRRKKASSPINFNAIVN